MAAWLWRRGITVDGISWNANELESAKPVCRNVLCWDLNAGLPPMLNETYDLAICSHILEHIAYPQKLLTDLHRVLDREGRLLVAIPNLFFWQDRWKLLRWDWSYESSGTFDYTHLRWYTQESMIELLWQHGFALTDFVADGWIPLPGLRFFITKKLRSCINKCFCRVLPGFFGRQLLVSLRKQSAESVHKTPPI